ncbi:5230_t:CDS:2, partial [Gigaspora rosea]
MDEICEIVPSQKGMDKINVRGFLMVKDKYPSSTEVAKSIAHIKEQDKETNDQPAQVIQNTKVTDMLAQPQNIDDIDVPDLLCSTLNGENFLVRDSIIGEDRILLFTTKANIQNLSKALYWIMDSTFKTVPTIFRQLYTIHAPIGIAYNSRVLPLVYALMTKKSEELYRALFQDLIEFAEESNILLRPTTILTDFELAAINVSRDEFPNVHNKGCFFHLGQTFLPSNEIPAAFDVLKEKMLPETNEAVQWFEDNYVHGKVRRQMHNGTLSCAPPLFPPQMWSVHDSIEIVVPRTSNIVEAWHRRWENLVGRPHMGVYTIVTEFQKEQQQVEHQIEAILRGAQVSPWNSTQPFSISHFGKCYKNKQRKEKKSKSIFPVKNKHKKGEKVQITKPGEEQTQERRE